MKFTCVTKGCKKRGQEVQPEPLRLNPLCIRCGRLLAGPFSDLVEYMRGRRGRLRGEPR